jgi:hypothetical protein
VPKRQLERVVVDVAQDSEKFYASEQVNAGEETTDPLLLSMDSKGIVMRQESLRESTKKAAEKEKRKHKTRPSKGEKRDRKRMSVVATVYDVGKHIRSAESIIGLEEPSETAVS